MIWALPKISLSCPETFGSMLWPKVASFEMVSSLNPVSMNTLPFWLPSRIQKRGASTAVLISMGNDAQIVRAK